MRSRLSTLHPLLPSRPIYDDPLSPLPRVLWLPRRKPRAAGHNTLTGPVLVAVVLAIGGGWAARATPAAGEVTRPTVAVGVLDAVDLETRHAVARPSLFRQSRTVAPLRASRARPVGPQWVRPCAGGVNSSFGRRWGRMHEGVDFSGGGYGAPVRAVGAGRVVFAGRDGGYGRTIRIRHANGVVTVYAHMSRLTVTGGYVRAGETIGRIGSSGHSTGPHLHFEVRIGGSPVSPLRWLRRQGVRV